MITIHGNEQEVLSTQLTEILHCFKDYKNLKFVLKYLEGVSTDQKFNQLDFENKIKNSKEGIDFSYEELEELEMKTHQFIEIELDVIDENKDKTTHSIFNKKIAKIRLVDSSYWEIETFNKLSIKDLMNLDGIRV